MFVILSDKYLKSPYCMYELLEVWRNCKAEDEVFRKRIRVYRLPDAKMMGPLERPSAPSTGMMSLRSWTNWCERKARGCWARRTSIATS